MNDINKKFHNEENDGSQKKALLIAVYHNNNELVACKDHLDELELLCETFGIHPLSKVPCLLRKFDASTYLTKGKLEELVEMAQAIQADIVVFDDEIAPSQQRNLETAFGLTVMDRVEIILGVFGQRAQTKEARLQVELAQVKYQAPRLKRLWTHLSRQAGTVGGGAYLKGEGEKQIEIDRRLLQRRIDQLQKEIKEVKANRQTQRLLREKTGIPVFAIVGYTNAGKSTLLNALTGANIFVEDKLFATLDTTTRKFTLPNNQEILLIDTVGFIRKLPHLLVAAFRSTLEEALQADILIHLVDASSHMALEQAETTMDVLKELGAENKPVITVLNKIDKCQGQGQIHPVRLKYPKTIAISALQKEGLDVLFEMMVQELSRMRKVYTFRVPQSDYAVVSEIISKGVVVEQEYEENDVLIKADVPIDLADRYSKYVDDVD